MRRILPRTLLAAAAAAALLSTTPTVAHAQLLKRLGRAAVEKATGDAVDRVAGRDSAGNAGATAAPTTAPLASTAIATVAGATVAPGTTAAPRRSPIEITPERLDRFIAAMQPLVSVAQKRRAHAAVSYDTVANAASAAIAASGLTSGQLGHMRERIGLYLLAPESSKLTDAERATVDARRKELSALIPYMLDGTLSWKSWEDLPQQTQIHRVHQ